MARDDRFISEGHAGESYVEVLSRLSAATGVRRYIEVGVSHGGVFGRIACRHGIGVDPLFQIDRNIMAHKSRVSLFQLTGDAFFRRMRPRRLLGGPADLVFLDGLHLFEALLWDFLNAEAVCAPDSIIALHDCLPLNAVMIGRDSDEANQLIRFPIDPFGMAEIGFAQAPRGLADTASGLIYRKRYQPGHRLPELVDRGRLEADPDPARAPPGPAPDARRRAADRARLRHRARPEVAGARPTLRGDRARFRRPAERLRGDRAAARREPRRVHRRGPGGAERAPVPRSSISGLGVVGW